MLLGWLPVPVKYNYWSIFSLYRREGSGVVELEVQRLGYVFYSLFTSRSHQ